LLEFVTDGEIDPKARSGFVNAFSIIPVLQKEVFLRNQPMERKVQVVQSLGLLLADPEAEFRDCTTPFYLMRDASTEGANAFGYYYLDHAPKGSQLYSCVERQLGIPDAPQPRPSAQAARQWRVPQ
jgi:hypothetical protein